MSGRSGVFAVIRLRFPSGGSEGWRGAGLVVAKEGLDVDTRALVDERESEIFGTWISVEASSREEALQELDAMRLSVGSAAVIRVEPTIEDGSTWYRLHVRGDLDEAATVGDLLEHLNARAQSGEVYTLLREDDDAGAVALEAYLPSYAEFAELFEALAAAVAAARDCGGEGEAAFIAEAGLSDVLLHGVTVDSTGTALLTFDPHGGSEEEYAPFSAHVEAVARIEAGYRAWLDEHDSETRLQRWAGLAGFIRPDGTWLVEPSFTGVRAFAEGRAAFKEAQRWGYLDAQGEVAVEPGYIEASNFQGGRARVRVSSSSPAKFGLYYGFIDAAGAVKVAFDYKDAGHFFEGRAAVQLGQRWGFVDDEGRRVVELRWGQAFQFSGGRALVCEKGPFDDGPHTWGFIDAQGGIAIPLELESAWLFAEGRARAMQRGKWGFLGASGDWVIDPTWDGLGDFADARAVVAMSGSYGLIDRDGAVVVEPSFEQLTPRGPLFEARRGDAVGYIDKDGNVVVEIGHAAVGDPRDGIIPVRPHADGPWGYRTREGEWLIEPRFEEAFPFSGGRAIVAVSDCEWAIVNRVGKIEHEFEGWITDASHFAENGVAYVARQALYGLVRTDGTLLIEIALEHLGGFEGDAIDVQFRTP